MSSPPSAQLRQAGKRKILLEGLDRRVAGQPVGKSRPAVSPPQRTAKFRGVGGTQVGHRARSEKCRARASRTRLETAVNRDGFSQFSRRPISSRVPLSVAPHDTYGLLFAVMPGHRHVLGGAARHIRSLRRRHCRRISMCPVPGNIISICVMDIARCWGRNVDHGFAIRRPVGEVPYCRPEGPHIVSPVMPERLGAGRMGKRMRRSNPSMRCCSRPGECLVRGKHKRYCAERRDNRPIHSIRHGTHQSFG